MSRLDDATTSRLYIEISNPPPDSSRFKMKVNCKNSSRVKYISDRDISLFQLRILYILVTWNSKTLERKKSMEYMVWDDERSIDRCAGDSRWTDKQPSSNCNRSVVRRVGARRTMQAWNSCERKYRGNVSTVEICDQKRYNIAFPLPGPLIEFSLAAFAVVVKEPATGFIVRNFANFDTLHQAYITLCAYTEKISEIPSLSTLIAWDYCIIPFPFLGLKYSRRCLDCEQKGRKHATRSNVPSR